jgi:ATP/maltotriose-dependent transcriptional regulator MalT
MSVLEDVAHLDQYLRLSKPSVLAVLAHVAGDFAQARELAEEALVVGGSEGDALAVYGATTGQVLWDMGALASMTPALEQTSQAHPGVTGFRGLLGCAYFDAGRLDDARAILRHEVETRFSEHPFNPLWLITISEFAPLCIALGEVEAARCSTRSSSVAGTGELERVRSMGSSPVARGLALTAATTTEPSATQARRSSRRRVGARCRRRAPPGAGACSRRGDRGGALEKHDSSRPKQRR